MSTGHGHTKKRNDVLMKIQEKLSCFSAVPQNVSITQKITTSASEAINLMIHKKALTLSSDVL